ncbi:sensor histidine kinase [Xinfangfangia pollutisoli]|uniref:sensor histidine kinase n=1 Tax=Xinfangfangia pollutisoli TaxID=2865960 RepID=UPI001CD2703A|nr:histidine kinase N-terminal 7TM domain-containing protein [Xinfangfangia pollutisoli]
MTECFEVQRIDALGGVTLFFWLGIFYLLYRSGREYFFGRHFFVIALAAMLYWLIAVFLELSSTTEECKIFWAKAAWPAIVLLPTAWAFFLTDYALGMSRRLPTWRCMALVLGPLAAAIVVATNDWHHLFYGTETRITIIDGIPAVEFQHGPLFLAFSVYLYLYLAWALMVTLRGSVLANVQHRSFFIGLLMVTLVPVLCNIFYIGFGFTVHGFDPTPFGFSISLFLLSQMIARNVLMDVAVIAKDLLFHNAPDPIVFLDRDGNQVGRNPEARRIFGREPGKSDGMEAENQELQGFISEIIDTAGHPTPRALTIRNRYFDPDVFPVRQPFGSEHVVIGWVLRLHDSTERRFLSGALQAERDFLSRLMETNLSGIIALDTRGGILFINAEAERILGLQAVAVREINLADPRWGFEWPEGTPASGLALAFARMLLDHKPIRKRRVSLLRRSDGERRVISVNATLLQSTEAEAKVVVSLADITDEYRTEISLRDAAAKSESENRSKSQFIANMSHEIRTPLNGVLGMAEVLDRLVQDAEQKKMLSTIRHSGELLLTILNDVLDMSKIEAGKLELEAALFRPEQIASRVHELYAVAADEKRLDLEIYTSGRPDMPRIGDPHRLMQILQNLVSNAIKFTHEGEISVVFSCPPGKPMVIEVRDTGIGMNNEQAQRIFNAFEQADGSVTRRFGGTGLGMAIVAKLVELMQGRIEVESQLGEGTTVRVILPLEEA